MKKNIATLLSFIVCPLLFAAEFNFTILHTNDLHSYFDGVITKESELVSRRGTYPRLAHAIREQRTKRLEKGDDFVILVDAGDFYSGTLFHALAPRADIAFFPEYEFFTHLNYDAITLGNHEFDAKDDGFANMMLKVKAMGLPVPIISTNFKTPTLFKEIIRPSIVKTYQHSKTGEKIKIGFIGALGPDGCKASQGMREKLSFHGYDDKKSKERWNDIIASLQDQAKALKASGTDIVVLLLHGGGEEDEKLAKKIPEINIIIAGHTHEEYSKVVGSTIISQAGSYGRTLGILPFQYDDHKLTLREKVTSSGLRQKITEEMPADEDIGADIKKYQDEINKILRLKKIPEEQVVVYQSKEDMPKNFESNNILGKLITSKVLDSLKDEDESIEFYFTTIGLIRTGIFKNIDYTTGEVFKILPLGFGKEFELGTPTISFYLKKKEVKKLAEFLTLYSSFDQKLTPVFSNTLNLEVRKWGIPFVNRISKLELSGLPYKEWPDLIHVSTNAFIFKYISFVNEKSFGLVKIVPRNKEGAEIVDVTQYEGEFNHLLHGLTKESE